MPMFLVQSGEAGEEKSVIAADKEKEFAQIENAWRWYEENTEVVYYSDLFRQFPKERIDVKACFDLKSVTAKASMETSVSKMSTEAVIRVDFEADFGNVRCRVDEEGDLVVVIPKLIRTIPVE